MICHQDFSIVSYPRELSQVVLNLIQNAQDALLKGQVVHPAIKVIIDNNKISVQDNAGGVEAVLIDRIFEPYFTTKSKTSSMGLGLYICKIILEKNFSAKIEFEKIKQTTSFNIIFSS
jgi:signal transduction histidine kinase